MIAATVDIHQALVHAVANKAAALCRNDSAERLLQTALRNHEGRLTEAGAFTVSTAPHTGRSPKDKFIVADALTRPRVWWDNAAQMQPERFEQLLADMLGTLAGRTLYTQDLVAGADPAHAFGIRTITETAWHALFIRNLLAPMAEGDKLPVTATVLHLPSFRADPERHGTRSSVVIALDMTRKLVLVGGTAYAGEIKKSVFSLFNFHAPLKGVFPMHCSANVGSDGDTALFFGLSGTGKTTLSTSEDRLLLGDDEHGWSDEGVFNLEGGCYAKTAKLSASAEPAVHAAVHTPGTVLENVATDPHGRLDLDDISVTENGRAAYPLASLTNVFAGTRSAAPRNVILLSADAFGVLPPIARLTPEQAVHFFLCGYTSKLAGTERGVVTPQATFSPCFGAPFMSLHPRVYGELLRQRLETSGAACWLVNTGWTGGPYGIGQRMPIAVTRRLVAAALSGELAGTYLREPVFGLQVPQSVSGVDPQLLSPRDTWADKPAFDAHAVKLRALFEAHVRGLGISDVLDIDQLRVAAE